MTQRDFTRGFLPPQDPLPRLPQPFAEWEAVAQELSKLLLSRQIRPAIEQLPPFPVAQLHSERELWRAMTMLCYMGSLYVLAPDHPVATRIPQPLAVAWHAVATRLGVYPMLSYAWQAMYNWRRLNPAEPVEVGNLTLNQNFLGGMDEEWFVTLHINIEAQAGGALSVLQPAQTAVSHHDIPSLESHLLTIAATLGTMSALLRRMSERCDPYIYYHRVRPFMFGWKDNPDIPQGMIYEGVAEYGGRPQQFRGETGAQSGIIPAFDAALGIVHEFDSMRAYLMEMRDYMPPADRAFVKDLENGPAIRTFVQAQKAAHPSLRDAYNTAVQALHEFRQLHVEYAAMYIIKPAQGNKQGDVGTGGTPFTVYLKKHMKETAVHLL